MESIDSVNLTLSTPQLEVRAYQTNGQANFLDADDTYYIYLIPQQKEKNRLYEIIGEILYTDAKYIKFVISESNDKDDHKVHHWAIAIVETLLENSKKPIKQINFVFLNKANYERFVYLFGVKEDPPQVI